MFLHISLIVLITIMFFLCWAADRHAKKTPEDETGIHELVHDLEMHRDQTGCLFIRPAPEQPKEAVAITRILTGMPSTEIIATASPQRFLSQAAAAMRKVDGWEVKREAYGVSVVTAPAKPAALLHRAASGAV